MNNLIRACKNWILKYFKHTYPYIILLLVLFIPLFVYIPLLGGIGLVVLSYLISVEVRMYNLNEEKKN